MHAGRGGLALKAFVTGATGFVGQHLCRSLVEEGWAVSALVRPGTAADELADLPLEICRGDITDLPSLYDAIPEVADAVFHVAASTNIWAKRNALQEAVNVGGTRNVIDAAIRARTRRFVHTSSFIIWGFHDAPVTEESPWLENANWINYVRTKRAAERLVKEAASTGDLDAVVMNPAHILGPGDRHNWSRMIRMVHTGKLPGVPPGGGAFADVREVARAHVAAFHRGRTGANYLLGGHDLAYVDLVELIGEILGRPVPGRASPAWVIRAIARVKVLAAALTGRAPDITPEGAALITRHIECDSSRAVSELGYGVTDPRRLLEDTCAWMREVGLLA